MLLYMIRENLDNIPEYPLPDGCEARPMQPGEEGQWNWICGGAFGHPFDFDKFMRGDACFSYDRIIIGKQYSQITSTAAAWHIPELGAHTGVLHMAATHPTAQGDGLGRPVIVAALKKLRELGYTRVELTTDDDKPAAIKLYMQLGFAPVYDSALRYEEAVRPAGDCADDIIKTRACWAEMEARIAALKSIHPARIQLWPNGAPLFDEKIAQAQPSLACYPVEGSRGAVIVCPGGGYVMKAWHEGGPIARMLNAAGISAYVLDYRVAPYVMPAPILDVNRAVRVARSLGYQKVGVLGFSAGGHLAAMAGTMYDAGKPDASDPIERLSSRPDAFVLCYAVVSFAAFTHAGSRQNIMGADVENWPKLRAMSGELRVTSDTPPCFLWHTASDECVPVENSLNMAAACVKNGVPVELHIFPEGVHGLGLAGGTAVGQWSPLCQRWLCDLGFGLPRE